MWAHHLGQAVKEVVVTRSLEASRAAVEAVLSPATIVEMAGTYEVESVEDEGDVVAVRGSADELEVVLEFRATDGPFVYRQREGPFQAMYTSLSVAGADPVTVTARSCYTFGLPFARLTDWLVARERRLELERILDGLEAALADRSADGPVP